MHQYRRSKCFGFVFGVPGNKACDMVTTKTASPNGAESITRHQVILGRGRQLRVLDL
jgi:hypothetical protein